MGYNAYSDGAFSVSEDQFRLGDTFYLKVTFGDDEGYASAIESVTLSECVATQMTLM